MSLSTDPIVSKRRANAPPPDPIRFPIELNSTSSPTELSQLIREYVRQLLYVRMQIPAPYSGLKAFVQENGDEMGRVLKKSKRKSGGGKRTFRKCKKLVLKLDALLASLDGDLFSRLNDVFIAVVFGAANRPKEVHNIEISRLSPTDKMRASRSRPSQKSKLIRAQCELIRAAEAIEHPIGTSTLHVFIRAPPSVDEIPGFIPKPNFELKLRKASQVCVEFKIGKGPSTKTCGEDINCTGKDDKTIWYKAINSVKGLSGSQDGW